MIGVSLRMQTWQELIDDDWCQSENANLTGVDWWWLVSVWECKPDRSWLIMIGVSLRMQTWQELIDYDWCQSENANLTGVDWWWLVSVWECKPDRSWLIMIGVSLRMQTWQELIDYDWCQSENANLTGVDWLWLVSVWECKPDRSWLIMIGVSLRMQTWQEFTYALRFHAYQTRVIQAVLQCEQKGLSLVITSIENSEENVSGNVLKKRWSLTRESFNTHISSMGI